ncbi:hypothetical protein [Nocardioides sp. zg-1228]|uniref:hypothetical protein n=1 Tax=Nocardioides sp. zg-1228 TaxID=2763008 RepID=UPI001642D38A|nr:hypothetical protein [Nocardioides sp. zg-1228]MBC2932384.1 hypothetical protein [Nocardioides sp. zg-1228]QSF57896.1 hypothetical protein JX575_01280 [Nocardioides sp. zg-1228]
MSIHGPAGVLDLVVPAGATSVDVAREYAKQAEVPGIPLLQTALGERLNAAAPLSEAGIEPGDVLVATAGVHRPRRVTLLQAAKNAPESPELASMVAWLAALVAVLAAWYAARSGDDVARTVVVGVLLACSLAGVLPVGRHARQRAAAAPAFAAAAAFAALHEPGLHLLPAILGTSAMAAAVVAGIGRALSHDADEVSTVWIVAGLAVFACCAVPAMLGWDARVAWTLLVFGSMMAARFAPSLAVDVPDEALLDLDRLAVTAWSARDSQRAGRRGRAVVAAGAMERLVHRASRIVTGASAAILVTMVVASPLLLQRATIDLDLIGARCLVLFAGCSLLLAARSYRHAAARALLRLAGLAALVALGVHLATGPGAGHVDTFFYVTVALGVVALAAAVATGRGWRSVWWSRRAEVAESLCGSFAFAAAVVASGVFRRLWELTS